VRALLRIVNLKYRKIQAKVDLTSRSHDQSVTFWISVHLNLESILVEVVTTTEWKSVSIELSAQVRNLLMNVFCSIIDTQSLIISSEGRFVSDLSPLE
jgi:hypothetical protein